MEALVANHAVASALAAVGVVIRTGGTRRPHGGRPYRYAAIARPVRPIRRRPCRIVKSRIVVAIGAGTAH